MRSNRYSTGFFKNILIALLLLLPLDLPGPAAATRQDRSVALLRFNSYSVNPDALQALNSQLKATAGKNRLFMNPSAGSESLWYEYEPGITLSGPNLSRYEALCTRLQCPQLMIGTVYRQQNTHLIQAKIYSSPDKRIICTLDQAVEGGDLKKTAELLIQRVSLFFDGKLPAVTGLTITQGTLHDAVSITWKSNISGSNYTITRSAYPNGPFETIGTAQAGRFTDTTAEAGIKYWYRVSASRDAIPGLSAMAYGHRKAPDPRGITLSELLGGHTKPWPIPATEKEKELEEKNLRVYKKYYESYIMVSFIILVGRIYINSGELFAFRGFKFHHFDQPNRTVYFSRPGMSLVKFHSKRFFRFFRDVQLNDLNFRAIRKRLIDNAVMFCIRTGEKEMTEPDGRIRYAPTFEVAGMMTEYHRDYENWKSNVIVFGTSDDDIYRRIKEAQSKGY